MTTIDRYDGLQSLLGICYEEGCHFLVLCSIIEEVNKRPTDIVDVMRRGMSKGWIRSDFFVNDAIAILEFYTGKKWERKEVDILPVIGYNDYTEAIYYNERTKKTHYRRRGFDTIDNSITVKEGHVVGYYVYTWR